MLAEHLGADAEEVAPTQTLSPANNLIIGMDMKQLCRISLHTECQCGELGGGKNDGTCFYMIINVITPLPEHRFVMCKPQDGFASLPGAWLLHTSTWTFQRAISKKSLVFT